MRRRVEMRRSLLRLSRFRELAAMQELAEAVVGRQEAVAAHAWEEGRYVSVSRYYAQATQQGRPLDLARYELFGELGRAAEARLQGSVVRVEEADARVGQASARLHEESERTDMHDERLRHFQTQLHADATRREQDQYLETWMQVRSTP